MSELKPFDFEIGDHELSLTLGQCAVVLFRTQQEVDYVCANIEHEGEDSVLRIFNNPELARWMAGYFIKFHEGQWYRFLYRRDNLTFFEEYGWNPTVIEKPEPSEDERQWYTEVNADSIDQEWQGMG